MAEKSGRREGLAHLSELSRDWLLVCSVSHSVSHFWIVDVIQHALIYDFGWQETRNVSRAGDHLKRTGSWVCLE